MEGHRVIHNKNCKYLRAITSCRWEPNLSGVSKVIMHRQFYSCMVSSLPEASVALKLGS